MRDVTFRAPLLDSFRRGEADRDLRLAAAAGELGFAPPEQLAVLDQLLDDGDAAVRAAAEQTLAAIPPGRLSAFLARPDVGADLRAAYARRGIQAVPGSTPEADGPLFGGATLPQDAEVPPATGEAERGGGIPAGGEPGGAETGCAMEADAGAPPGYAGAPPPNRPRRVSTIQRLATMSVTERVKAAMLGTRDERAILIRDTNKLVAAAVLSSPKLSQSEVEAFAKMATVSDEVLRLIGTNRTWTKQYAVLAAVVRNPKTPIAVSLNLVSRLNERDIKMLSMDRNVPEPVRVAARKHLLAAQSRRG